MYLHGVDTDNFTFYLALRRKEGKILNSQSPCTCLSALFQIFNNLTQYPVFFIKCFRQGPLKLYTDSNNSTSEEELVWRKRQ